MAVIADMRKVAVEEGYIDENADAIIKPERKVQTMVHAKLA